MAADNLSTALTELRNISEGRIANLIDQSVSGLPEFLIESNRIMYVDLRQNKKPLSDYTFIREINDIADSD